jgi:hypothetical protein
VGVAGVVGVVVVGAVGDVAEEDLPPQATAMTAKNTAKAIRMRNNIAFVPGP